MHLKSYRTIRDLFYSPKITDKSFICKVCGKQMSTFNYAHFHSHNLDKQTYIEKFGYPNEYYLRQGIQQDIIDQIYSIYVHRSDKWLSLSATTKTYCTNETGQENFRKLRPSDIFGHLEGGNTIGVFAFSDKSKFLVFDVDSYDSLADAQLIVRRIKHVLRYYLPTSQIHTVNSGSKGYHVTLYFDKYIFIDKLAQLFNGILDEICADQYKNVIVEMRPDLHGNLGLKLPLGINHINQYGENNYCCFCDSDFLMVDNEIEYFLKIKKSDASVVDRVINDFEHENNYSPPIVKSNALSADKSINSEIELGTRHKKTFIYCLQLKQDGYNEQEVYKTLLSWSLEQKRLGLSKSSDNEIERDIKNIIKYIYHKNEKCHLYQINNVYIYKSDLELFEKINKVKTSGTVRSQQKVLFAMIIHGRRHTDNKNEEFYMTYNQIQSMTGINHRTSVHKYINDLEKWGLINVLSRNKQSETNPIIKEPNVYRINYDKCDDLTPCFNVCDKIELCNDCFFLMIKKCYSESEMNRILKYRLIKQVLGIDDKQCCKEI